MDAARTQRTPLIVSIPSMCPTRSLNHLMKCFSLFCRFSVAEARIALMGSVPSTYCWYIIRLKMSVIERRPSLFESIINISGRCVRSSLKFRDDSSSCLILTYGVSTLGLNAGGWFRTNSSIILVRISEPGWDIDTPIWGGLLYTT